MDIYKDTAVELYRNKIKEVVPEISESELNSLSSAFITGFNMGIAQNESGSMKELALKMMVR